MIEVDPRVCGEGRRESPVIDAPRGRSPRVRGRPLGSAEPSATEGSIPACAGKARLHTEDAVRGGVDPRVCGEGSPR